jgi:integrase
MKTKFERTKCSVILKKSRHRKGGYYLAVEAYPVYSDNSNKPERPTQAMGQLITTPIWDKSRPTRGGGYLPKRNAVGVIQCRSKADQEACEFAQKYAQKQQTEYDHKALYPEQYKAKQKAEKNANMDLIEYITNYLERRRPFKSGSLTYQWESMRNRLKEFRNNGKLLFGDFTLELAEQFREYMLTGTKKNGDPLAQNTKKLYWEHFKKALFTAHKDEILPRNMSIMVEQIQGEETEREALEKHELQQVAYTTCDCDETGRAALLSSLTSWRYIDIAQLKWEKLSGDEVGKPRCQKRAKKTGKIIYQPISETARLLCGERKNPDDLVFPNIATGGDLSKIIRAWVKRAGINKDITFHCFRHTYGTLQLKGGTNLFVVSKLMQHSSMKTTEAYLHMTDEDRENSVNVIQLDIKQ